MYDNNITEVDLHVVSGWSINTQTFTSFSVRMAQEEIDSTSNCLTIEAQAAVTEVSFAVDFVEISSKLPITNECIFINIRTKEKKQKCVELSVSGFRVSL